MNDLTQPWNGFRAEHYRHIGELVATKCNENGFKARYLPSVTEALDALRELIPAGASVAVPGTVTIREMGALGALEARGCRVIQHWDPSLKTPEEKQARLAEEMVCDFLLTSANGVTHDGKIVNIDGTGNRVAAMSWATGKIIFVVGVNKISRTVESALERIRDWATPMNGLRLGMEIPCAKVGRCMDCNHPQRACRVVTVHEKAPFGRECHVLLVGETLGF